MITRAVLALPVLVLVLAGCGGTDTSATSTAAPGGGDTSATSGSSSASGSSSSIAAADTVLTIEAYPDGSLPDHETISLSCGEGATGTVDDPQGVCDRLLAEPDDLWAPIPGDVACTEIYGGPEKVVITGTLRGAPISMEYSRSNGCNIDRYERLIAIGLVGPSAFGQAIT